MSDGLTNLTDWLDAMPRWTKGDGARYEFETLLKIRDWAIESLPIHEGDRVRILRDQVTTGWVREDGSTNGWWPYREALEADATGVATAIEFNAYHGQWRALVSLDEEWTTDEQGNHSPRHPGQSLFCIRVGHLEAIEGS